MSTKLRKIYCADRKSPYQLSWRELGKRHSRFFKTESERDSFLEKHSFLNDTGFSSIMKLSDQEISDIALLKSSKPNDVSIMEIWNFWKRNHKDIELITTWNACNKYILDMKAQGRDKNHITRVSRILELFCETYEDRLIEHITRQELEDWLKALPYQGQTRENYKSILRTAWTYFEHNGWVSKNVADKLSIGKVQKKEIGILTVEETEKLFRANEFIDPEICGLMALGLFAGMRSSGISRVDYNEINFADKGIEIPSHKAKSGRRCYIENLPDNLWAWLEKTPKSAFDMHPRNFKKRRENAYRRAGLLLNAQDLKRMQRDRRNCEAIAVRDEVPSMAEATRFPPHNAFRHSFVSYHVALHRKFQDTALIVSHRGTNILFEHYLGFATKENAQKYFEIYPKDYAKSIEKVA